MNSTINKITKRFLCGCTGLIMASLALVSCEKGFDQIEIPEDVLAPGEVSSLAATAEDARVTLTWRAPIDNDLKGFEITYTPGGTEPLILGPVNTIVIEELENGVEYTFTVASVDGLDNVSQGVSITATPDIVRGPELLSFFEDFNTSCPSGLPEGWVGFSVASNIDWECVDPLSDGNYALQGNGFGADEPADDWLITPGIDLSAGNNVVLDFKYSAEFSDVNGFGLSVLISTDYNGSGDPTAATWEVLNAGVDNTRSSSEFANALPVRLSSYSGTAYVAFRYTSSGTGGGTTLRARVDDVRIAEPSFANFPLEEDFNASCPSGLPENWVGFSVASNIDWECVDPSGDGNYALQGNGFGADAPADDWLITPGVELPVGNFAELNFTYSTEFSDAEGFGLEALISTDYSGSGDPTVATWEALNAGIDNTRGSSELVNALPVSLSDYSGVVYVAFRYTSSGTGGGATLRARVDDVRIAQPVFENFPFAEDFNASCPEGLPENWVGFSVASNMDWECVDPQADGNYALQGNGFGADEPADDWLITPGIQLPAGNAALLNFKYSAEFSDAEGFGLEVLISSDYSCSGDPTGATWETVSAGVDNTRGSSELVNAAPFSLSDYTGKVYLAFRYTSSGTGGGETLRARVDDVAIQ